MREIDARVVGFDYTTYHAYTTEVEVDGCSWSLAIRYNTFYQFYTRLTALEKHFTVEFPPKGGLFFSPPPEERQEQLDDFLLSTLAYFDMRGHPKRMGVLLGELLQIPEHLNTKEEDDERTASEGSSVAEELLDDDHDVHMDTQNLKRTANQEAPEELQEIAMVDHEHDVIAPVQLEVDKAELEEKPEVAEEEPEEEQGATEAMRSPKSESSSFSVERQQSQELTGGSVAKNYIAMLRRKTLVDGAIQAAVVSTMKANVAKFKTDKAEKASDEKKPVEVEEIKSTEVIAETHVAQPTESEENEVKTSRAVEVDDQVVNATEPVKVGEKELELATLIKEEKLVEATSTVATDSTAVESTPVSDSISPVDTMESEVAVASAESFDSASTSDVQPAHPVQEGQEDEEATPELSKEPESENPVRRRRPNAEAIAKAQEELKVAEADAKAEETADAEILRAEQELNLRLGPYRHPVFFQGFNCDVGTSRYSLPQRLSEGIVV
eukprot:jgi/Phyca11/11292/fgenesh1_pm.PHYCAscaffold_66_\